MLGENMDVDSAGFRVGFEEPSDFSRDYKKFFGTPPQRDIARLRSNLEHWERKRPYFTPIWIRQNNFYDKNQLQTDFLLFCQHKISEIRKHPFVFERSINDS